MLTLTRSPASDDVAWLVSGASASLVRIVAVVGAASFLQPPSLLLFQAHERAALFRVRILAVSVCLATLVVLGQMFGDGKTFLVAEQQSVAVFPALHLLAGADPELLVDLFLLVLEEHARAERFPDLVDVLR